MLTCDQASKALAYTESLQLSYLPRRGGVVRVLTVRVWRSLAQRLLTRTVEAPDLARQPFPCASMLKTA